jgi:hypothetical protein
MDMVRVPVSPGKEKAGKACEESHAVQASSFVVKIQLARFSDSTGNPHSEG